MARRKFTREFKTAAVEMVTHKGYSMHMAARQLGIDHKSLYDWVAKDEAGKLETGSPEGLRTELRRLRKENTRLRLERDILKKATAFFAREHR